MACGYERVASVYDALADFYSLGAIRRTQGSATSWIREADRVLLAGSGTAVELELCSVPGVSWTVLDSSRAMIARARRRTLRFGQSAEFVEMSLEDYATRAKFDVVLAPFFLNVFPTSEVPAALSRLTQTLRPGGTLVVADFACGGPPVLQLIRQLYYLPPLLLFRVLTGNPWHELYDYARIVSAAALPLQLMERRRIPVLGVPLFETSTFRALPHGVSS